MGDLNDTVAIVTGAGRGIGRAQALFFAGRGARLVVNDLGCDGTGQGEDPTVAETIASEVREAGGTAVASSEDIRAAGAAERLVKLAVDRYGELHTLVSSAGIGHEGALLHTGPEDDDALLAYARANMQLSRVVAQRLVQQKQGGAIILTTSPCAFFGTARQSAAAAAAGAVASFTRSAAVELRRHAIRINALAPTARTRLTAHLPLYRGVTEDSMGPAHVAPVAAFLASPEAAEITGEVIGVGGGRLYALSSRESTGAFSPEGPFLLEDIAARWSAVVKR